MSAWPAWRFSSASMWTRIWCRVTGVPSYQRTVPGASIGSAAGLPQVSMKGRLGIELRHAAHDLTSVR
ncbi:hypothetical protein MB27_34320 [Actinoplanes utahensis]|uniref:Uncharacterized protein n=1 Tax=Actinoplanes utahensis TaxID=1869 RepID=A0A0A6UC07_ACTUT|nr:hypothetical protein MB27_34320 [Actinoplanes utahensis]